VGQGLLDDGAARDGSFAGTWKTSYGVMSLTSTTGNKVEGAYAFDAGTIDGTLSADASVLEGTYKESEAKGSFKFTLTEGGRRFKGNWQRTSGKREPPSGNWEGRCIEATEQ
jgi:hypothetical protein